MRATAAQLAGLERIPATQVPCSTCDGHGYVHLPQTYARTHVLVSSGWEPTSAIHARHTDGVKLSALCNRLNELARYGLVEKRRHLLNAKVVEWRRK